ncbi:MAG: cytochrome C oxidase subunit II [Gemmatimonadota bacterium]|jgi:cytochrome c oxidase subunit 2|nr:cytochrome C oxidase subunit II [Gemmatimonadota bacterium]MDP6803333.1 cytochrome C oxidase subunit II [Gemmatimonadota bacterium]MDP7031485.1 cytochrome C oxidase subunit II [Gemmatimonadota bacterium]
MIEHLIPAASTYATDIDGLITLIAVLVGFWFIAAEVVFFWLLFRFRKKEGRGGQYITGEEKRQKRWITIPHLLVLVCDIFIIVGAVRVWYVVKQDFPEAQETVRITAQQWAWTFEHPGPDGVLDTADDITTMNELHLQKDRTYHFELAAKDVVHSFSVPAFRLKQDAVPGRIIKGWFQPTLTGDFGIQCAEICGVGHALMGARLFVENPAEHAAWMNPHSTLTLAAADPAPALEE